MATRLKYLSFRDRYRPETIKLLLVAESPPVSGRYFYNPAGVLTEPLFAALMREIGVSPATKEEGLLAFQASGWLLVDASYEPVNSYDDRRRDEVISRDYELLREDLDHLSPGRTVPIILLKANVCRLLEPRLTADGFNVLNGGRLVYFPSTGRQGEFREQLGAILRGTKREKGSG
jgi:hypothetical protein